jgi:hypothetical protein
MIDVSLESKDNEYTVLRFPASASDSNTNKWLRITFGD